jgi:hypothetical protein
VGTFDGFWAFEMERRGAGEVVALDLDDPERLDWPLDARRSGPEAVRRARATRGPGFEVAHRALGSSVKRVDLSVYDLDPTAVGPFDVVFVGAILLHLRDPIRALEAIRTVTGTHLVLAEPIEARLELFLRGLPAARFHGVGIDGQWWIPNRSALARFLASAGFAVVARTRPFVTPFGTSAWAPRPTVRRRMRNAVFAGSTTDGALTVGLRARPVRRDA